MEWRIRVASLFVAIHLDWFLLLFLHWWSIQSASRRTWWILHLQLLLRLFLSSSFFASITRGLSTRFTFLLRIQLLILCTLATLQTPIVEITVVTIYRRLCSSLHLEISPVISQYLTARMIPLRTFSAPDPRQSITFIRSCIDLVTVVAKWLLLVETKTSFTKHHFVSIR